MAPVLAYSGNIDQLKTTIWKSSV